MSDTGKMKRRRPKGASKMRGAIHALEARLIREELARRGGNVTHAARGLGIPFRTLHEKIKKHGINLWEYRDG